MITEKTEKKQNMLSHFFAIGTGSIINMILGLIATPIITRIVDPDEYGQLSIFNTYSSIGLMVLCLGLDQALVRFFYDDDDIKYKRSLLKLCIKVPLILSLIILGGISILALLDVKMKFNGVIMVLLAGNLIVLVWNRIAVLLLRVTYQSKKYAICNVLHRVLYIAIVLGLSLTIKDNYLLILVVATIVSMIVPSIYATLLTSDYWNFHCCTKLQNEKEIYKYSLPLILAMGLGTLSMSIDRLSLDWLCDYSEVGIYTSAQTLASAFAIIQTTFNTIWAPMQVEAYTNNPDDKSFFQKGNQYITVIMFIFGWTLILFKDFLSFLLGEQYRAAAVILPFLIMEPIFYSISQTTHTGIGYSKKSYLSVIIALITCCVNFCGNLVLIPLFGCKGAAISTGISAFVNFIIGTVISLKLFYVDYKMPRLLVLVALTTVYAFFNTFYSSAVYSIIIYVVCLIALWFLYKEPICSGFKLGVNQCKSILKKGNK